MDSLLSWCVSLAKKKRKKKHYFFMLEYNISLKFFLCHKMHAKNLKIFNVFLFSKADDDKALFCSFSFLPYLGGGKLGSVPGSGGFPGKRWLGNPAGGKGE